MSIKNFIQEYLMFTRKERIGIICIILLIIAIAFAPNYLNSKQNLTSSLIDTSWFNEVQKLKIETTDSESSSTYFEPSAKSEPLPKKFALFYFDPNTISENDWQKMGLKNKTIKTIQNYISKGGYFYKPEDLKKIYGLRQEEYERLEPFIKIESKKIVAPNNSHPNESSSKPKPFTVRKYEVIDINTADSNGFISLPGIGSKLAIRIINFREKLGGFYSVVQVSEIYRLSDSTFQTIKPLLKFETETIKKININTATVDELKVHPYIRWNLAQTIVAYRNQHGAFQSLEDLKKIVSISDEVYTKIFPYLMVE